MKLKKYKEVYMRKIKVISDGKKVPRNLRKVVRKAVSSTKRNARV